MIDKEILTKFYSSDDKLIKEYHVLAGSDLETCIERTYNDLLDVEIEYIKENDEIIGYFGLEKSKYCNFLVGFFVMPELRKDKKYWKEIESKLPQNTHCGLFTKNTRAIRFLENNNYKRLGTDNTLTVFKIK